MSTNADWAKGYARQAEADFNTWNVLQGSKAVPQCHKLLFLQMACEKLTKAHLCASKSNPEDLRTSHAYVAKNLPIIVRLQLIASNLNPKGAAWVGKHAKHLAQEIELLAPAVKRGGQRPDNCEYPWQDGAGVVHVPLDWAFYPIGLLAEPAGRTFLKHVQNAIRRFL